MAPLDLSDHPAAPDFICPDFEGGLALARRGRYKQALAKYSCATAQYPNWPHPLYNAAHCLQSLGRRQEAIAAYRRVLAISPHHVRSMANLEVLLSESGQTEEALQLCQQVIQHTTKGREKAYCNYALALEKAGQTNLAIENLRSSIAENPVYASAQYNLGFLLHKQERYDEAIECYRAALAAEPDYANAFYHMTNAVQKQGRIGDAVSLWDEYLAKYPHDVRAMQAQAVCLMVRTDETGGRHLLQRCRQVIFRALWHNPANLLTWVLVVQYLNRKSSTPA